MRATLSMLVLAMMVSATADAADRTRHFVGNPRMDLFVDVPLDYDTSVVFPFGGSHHAVPGVATINQAPYYLPPAPAELRERAAFVEHLSVKHGLTDREIPSMVLVELNQVRYVGD